MSNEPERGLPLVGVDHGCLWNRSAENAGDVVEAEDDDGDPLPASGRARQSCVEETHVMGGFSPTCFKTRATVKETSPSSAKS